MKIEFEIITTNKHQQSS